MREGKQRQRRLTHLVCAGLGLAVGVVEGVGGV